jgi:hypothetical protein
VAVAAWAVALAAILLWPLTRSGYLLGHDMVFTPRQPLDLASVGVSSSSPRAVPLDALVALAERVVNGAVVGRVALLVPVLAAGLGTAALLGSRSQAARLACCGMAIWNPFVVERLALGQWALLWGYAALPWLMLAIARGQGPAGWLARAVAVAAASITPTGGLIAAVTAVAVAAGLRRGRREVAATTGLALLLQLPWLVPALVSSASATSDPAAVADFAARAEHPGGVLLSLLGGGGIWDAEVVPGSRGGALPWLGLAVVLAAASCAARLRRLLGAPLFRTSVALAAGGLMLAMLSSVPGGAAAMRAVVEHVSGGGLFRDAQKWIMPLVVLEALLVGAAVDVVVAHLRSPHWRGAAVAAALATPLILLPDAAATLRPTLEPVHYPRDWRVVASAARGGPATVVPFASYRLFGWAPGRSVLDPAPRLLDTSTVVDDRLAVAGRLRAGEDPRARQVAAALSDGGELPRRLAAAGISWVVVEHGTPGVVPDLSGLELVYAGSAVSLYRVPGEIRPVHAGTAKAAAVLGADALAVLLLLALVARAAGARVTKARSGWGRERDHLGDPLL